MFEKNWTVPDAIRERKAALEKIASAAEDVYLTWFDWVVADDPEGDNLRGMMENLGEQLLEAGFIVPQPIPVGD